MTPEYKAELLARHETLMMQIQQAQLEGRFDDVQVLQQSLRQIEAELYGTQPPKRQRPSLISASLIMLGMGLFIVLPFILTPTRGDYVERSLAESKRPKRKK